MEREIKGQEGQHDVDRRGSRWRAAAWSGAGLILLIPLIAMQFTDEVNWDIADFAIAGTLVGGVGALYELVVRKKGDTAYRAAAALALGAALLLVWLNGAVGVIGSEDNDANLMYFGVLAVGITGAAIARFQPLGMARAMFATAFTIAFVAAVALIAGMGSPDSGPMVIVVLNAFFVALFVASAWLFRQAARA